MKHNALLLTRRGIFLFHWGLELYAATVLGGIALGALLMFGVGWAMNILMYFAMATPYVTPVFQIMMIAGVLLTTAAPTQTRTIALASGILVSGVVASGFTILVYLQQWPMEWLQNSWLLLYVQALLFTRLLLVLCRWIASVEQSDVETADQSIVAADRSDVLIWSKLEKRLKELFWVATVFLGVCLLTSMRPDWVFGVIGFNAFGIVSLAGLVFFLLLLARFSRVVYTFNAAFRSTQDRPEQADRAWEQVPADRLKPVGVFLTVLALGANRWSERALAPAYLSQQLAQFNSGPQGLAVDPTGQIAPELQMQTIQGETIALSEQKGKVVLLNFWATWCGPCVTEIPDLAKLSRDNGVTVIGVSDESSEILQSFVQTHEIPYSVVSGSGWPSPFDNISAIPTTYLIDKEGVIRSTFVGSQSYEVFRNAIDALEDQQSLAPENPVTEAMPSSEISDSSGEEADSPDFHTEANFEEFKLSHWEIATWKSRPQQVSASSEVFHEGSSALRIHVTEDADDVSVYQAVAVIPNSRYRLTGWIRTEDVTVDPNESGTTGAILNIFDREDSSESILGTTDWKQVTLEFHTGDQNVLNIGCRLGHHGSTCTGTAWFDDLKLEKVE
jgi:peroxiredoxin